MFLSGMQSYGRLEIEVNSSCDTTLLVRDAYGQWHFDDDSGGNLTPELNLRNMAGLNGRIDVWVGTYGNATCRRASSSRPGTTRDAVAPAEQERPAPSAGRFQLRDRR
jgi:hypothetical protein